jgi:hypothetical protein
MRFAYFAVSHAFAAMRLLPMSDREKDVEILALRHQLTVLQRQLGGERPRFPAGGPGALGSAAIGTASAGATSDPASGQSGHRHVLAP